MYRERVLAHLLRYPQLQATAGQLRRALRLPSHVTLDLVLSELETAGLVRRVRKRGDCSLVIHLWQAASRLTSDNLKRGSRQVGREHRQV